jgi:23S rRNA pseudouridine2605 synthase
MLRLPVYLARAGIASRREAGRIIKEKRVKINGKIVDNPGTQVDETSDHVRVDDKLITKLQPLVYLVLNKPPGVVTTHSDPEGRQTVFDYIDRVKCRVEPIGRLDYDVTGLLPFTNDGQLANKLMRPASMVQKVYLAVVRGNVGTVKLKELSKGLIVDGRKSLPASARIIAKRGNNTHLLITVVEGRYHHVKNLCEAMGHPARRLKRVAFGPLTLGDLGVGQFRYLSDREIVKLRRGDIQCADLAY